MFATTLSAAKFHPIHTSEVCSQLCDSSFSLNLTGNRCTSHVMHWAMRVGNEALFIGRICFEYTFGQQTDALSENNSTDAFSRKCVGFTSFQESKRNRVFSSTLCYAFRVAWLPRKVFTNRDFTSETNWLQQISGVPCLRSRVGYTVLLSG